MSIPNAPAKAPLWIGRVLSGLVIAFMLLDSTVKLVPIQPVIDTLQALGFVVTPMLARGLGVLGIICTLLYAIPRTSLIGAILLTGYLGGAMAIQLRAGNPLFTHLLFGGYVGLMLWAGLLLRSPKTRAALFS